MRKLIIELTNRCNLDCSHCFSERHNDDGFMDIEILRKVLEQSQDHGVKHISFTGGEPTLHPEFSKILELIDNSGLTYSLVTNGQNFKNIYNILLTFRQNLKSLTFSLDGASAAIHDQLRGHGAFKRLMKAVSICAVKDIPFTFNMVVTAYNSSELNDAVDLAYRLGSKGIRFCCIIPTPQAVLYGLVPGPDEQKNIENYIQRLKNTVPFPVYLSPGFYTKNLFPCDSLQEEECNIDWKGRLSICCHLSGYDFSKNESAWDLNNMTFAQALGVLQSVTKAFRNKKTQHHGQARFTDTDYFPCWYCYNFFGKMQWLKFYSQNIWARHVWSD